MKNTALNEGQPGDHLTRFKQSIVVISKRRPRNSYMLQLSITTPKLLIYLLPLYSLPFSPIHLALSYTLRDTSCACKLKMNFSSSYPDCVVHCAAE